MGERDIFDLDSPVNMLDQNIGFFRIPDLRHCVDALFTSLSIDAAPCCMIFVTHPNAIIGQINIEIFLKKAHPPLSDILQAITKKEKYIVMTSQMPTSMYSDNGHIMGCGFFRDEIFFQYAQLNFSKSPISSCFTDVH